MATKSFKNFDVVKAGMEVLKAKNSKTTLNALQNVTSVDFSQVTVPLGTIVAFPDISEVDDYLYADKSVLNGTEYVTYGLLCPVVDASDNVIGTKRISLNNFQREMPVYEMQDGVPVATARTLGGNTEMARTLRGKEIVADKVRYLCSLGKAKVVKEEDVPSPRYTNGVITGIRNRKIAVWDKA